MWVRLDTSGVGSFGSCLLRLSWAGSWALTFDVLLTEKGVVIGFVTGNEQRSVNKFSKHHLLLQPPALCGAAGSDSSKPLGRPDQQDVCWCTAKTKMKMAKTKSSYKSYVPRVVSSKTDALSACSASELLGLRGGRGIPVKQPSTRSNIGSTQVSDRFCLSIGLSEAGQQKQATTGDARGFWLLNRQHLWELAAQRHLWVARRAQLLHDPMDLLMRRLRICQSRRFAPSV